MASRLRQANPRLDEAKSLFLASELSARLPDGRYTWDFDPRHRAPFATLHRRAEWAACLALVRAPTLFIGSDLPFPPALRDEPEGLAARAAAVPGARFERIARAGHNLHYDEPEAVARLWKAPYRDLGAPARELGACRLSTWLQRWLAGGAVRLTYFWPTP
jgi:pimeloyl-ACP methyl ester carboxylesterase